MLNLFVYCLVLNAKRTLWKQQDSTNTVQYEFMLKLDVDYLGLDFGKYGEKTRLVYVGHLLIGLHILYYFVSIETGERWQHPPLKLHNTVILITKVHFLILCDSLSVSFSVYRWWNVFSAHLTDWILHSFMFSQPENVSVAAQSKPRCVTWTNSEKCVKIHNIAWAQSTKKLREIKSQKEKVSVVIGSKKKLFSWSRSE